MSLIRFVAALAACFIASAACGDEVVLQNSDRLTGRVISKSQDVLTLETSYAGTLKIRWSQVAALRTDGPVSVLVAGEQRLLRGAVTSEGERLSIVGREVPLTAVAYINPTPDQSGTGRTYSGRANVSAAYARGNNEYNRTYGDAALVVRAKAYRYSIEGQVNSRTEGGVETASSWLASTSFDRFIDRDRFLYLRGSLEHDRFKNVDLRSTAGAGYGWQFLETQRTNVSLRTGLDYVTVDRLAAPDEAYPALGWGVKATHKLTSGGTELFHDQEGFWNLKETDRVILRSRTGLRVPLMEHLSASLQLNLDWEREPAAGRHPTDSNVLLGLTYAW